MPIAQDTSYSPKPQGVAPINVYPTFQDHLNVMCHRKMLCRDRKIENPRGSASKFWVSSYEINILLICLPLYHAIRGPEEFSPYWPLKLPGKQAPKQSAWTQMSLVRRPSWYSEVQIYVRGILDMDDLHLRHDKRKNMTPLLCLVTQWESRGEEF